MSIVPFLKKISTLILNPVLALLFFIAFVIFVYGIVRFIMGASDDKAREEGKRAIGYSLIGMFVMISVYGIMRFVLSTFGIDTNIYPLAP
ncbi:MAG: hypothetical protein A2741_01490 [Candidatus Zambryskibacteria bacterium RIFCSPHIGHO2_01_FULL_43_27]|uniref:Uncharacterized protein n=1 Tax=Candidatus Zambryskibacteria bacterium RIFCSPLOWO2_01_FULL_43_17 TaxID=1802760 RepID=A0A1G2U182_9BACT|nr:MAG: hypothetical protein A2741_01490 [Candidatus Zambryskibacteria bacterium RIFCSPHIGHO2_01_FULL_43_27]OHA99451.1 MAG: hypothetical protein A3E93_02600 [Candidatus Zambryskibacteria bacterium RIFCSPHIGHO2_12_FULL_43_12b]OHB03286.1 MAG: hypothetical protein A2920_00220 [Candidatus Zambryskibacteria bacterium RIFCSPLOWO2_01_FULL_43_17]